MLDRPIEASYDVRGLPHLNYAYQVGIAIDKPIDYFLPPWAAWPGSKGNLRLRLLNDDGSPIIDCAGELFRFNWTSKEGDWPFSTARFDSPVLPGVNCATRFELQSSPYHPSRLDVTYQPEPGAPNVRARVRIASAYQ